MTPLWGKRYMRLPRCVSVVSPGPVVAHLAERANERERERERVCEELLSSSVSSSRCRELEKTGQTSTCKLGDQQNSRIG